MVMTNNNDFYKTSDTALAAYLIEQGFGNPDIEKNGRRAFFIFPSDIKIDEAVHAWDTVKAEGNVVLFFRAYQSLLRRIREDY